MPTPSTLLLYDDYCPLCTWYSGLFVKYGLLNRDQRLAFSQAEPALLQAIDLERGKDEIPLHDPHTGTTLYGIDALLELIGRKLPLVSTIGKCPPLHWLLKKIYKLISYNRKVIVARKCGPGRFDCSPHFNLRYRLLFLLGFLFFNSLMLYPLHSFVFTRLTAYHLSAGELQLSHLGFAAVNCSIALSAGRYRAIEYLGQINMLAILAILRLSLLLITSLFIHLPEALVWIYLIGLTAWLVREYRKRMQYAGVWTEHKPLVYVNLFCLAGFLGYIFHQ